MWKIKRNTDLDKSSRPENLSNNIFLFLGVLQYFHFFVEFSSYEACFLNWVSFLFIVEKKHSNLDEILLLVDVFEMTGLVEKSAQTRNINMNDA